MNFNLIVKRDGKKGGASRSNLIGDSAGSVSGKTGEGKGILCYQHSWIGILS